MSAAKADANASAGATGADVMILDIKTSKAAAVGARYKMPAVLVKVEGGGGATKTVVINCAQIAAALHTEAAYVMKWLSLELSVPLHNVHPHALKGDKPAPVLQKCLQKFIAAFVLCPACGLPELKLTCEPEEPLKGRGKHAGPQLRYDCASCAQGHGYVRAGDAQSPESKLRKWMIAHPPVTRDRSTADAAVAAKADALAAEADQAAARIARRGGAKKRSGDGDEDDGVEWFTDTSAEAVKKRQTEELASLGAAPAAAGAAAATKADAAAAKVDAPAPAAGQGGDTKPAAPAVGAAAALVDAKVEDPVLALSAYVRAAKRSADDIVGEWKRVCVARGLGTAATVDPALQQQRIGVLLRGSLRYGDAKDLKTVARQIATDAGDPTPVAVALRKGLGATAAAQRMALNELEHLLSTGVPKLLPYTPHVLKALFEADVCSEAAIVAWAAAPAQANAAVKPDAAKAVRLKASPFVEWLQTAESDDE